MNLSTTWAAAAMEAKRTERRSRRSQSRTRTEPAWSTGRAETQDRHPGTRRWQSHSPPSTASAAATAEVASGAAMEAGAMAGATVAGAMAVVATGR